MFLSFDLETQLNIVESLPKKRYSFSADYSKVQSGFLALLTVHREKLNPSIKRALLANVNKLAKTIAKELKENKGYVTTLNRNKIKIFKSFEPRFLDLIKDSISHPYLNNTSKQIEFLTNYSDILLGKNKLELLGNT